MSLTPEQKALRRTGIGGSEVSAILGESRFASPFDVWLRKTQGWEQASSPDLQRGTFLESGIGRWYADRFNTNVDMNDETIRHARNPIALCTPDMWAPSGFVSNLVAGEVVEQSTSSRLVSIKSPRRGGPEWGDDGSSKVPTEYALQLQWEHMVASSHWDIDDEMHLAALIDGDLCVCVIRADRELQADMLEFATKWWERHVVRGEQPSLDGSSQAKQWLRNKFPQDSGVRRDAVGSEIRLMVELELAEEEKRRAHQRFDDVANQLRLSMMDAYRLDGPNGHVTWKTDARGNKAFRTRWTKEK